MTLLRFISMFVSEPPQPRRETPHSVLSDFLDTQGYPAGAMHLKRLLLDSPIHSLDNMVQSFTDLMSTGRSEKSAVISELLQNFPHRKFVLVGSSADKDPEIFGMGSVFL